MFFQVVVSVLIAQILAQYPPGVPPISYRQNVQNDNLHNQNDESQKHYQPQPQRQQQQQQQQQRGPLFDEKYLSAEKDHIGEHLNAEYDSKSITDDEFFFLQFKAIDSDNSKHIDGLEMYKAIYHALTPRPLLSKRVSLKFLVDELLVLNAISIALKEIHLLKVIFEIIKKIEENSTAHYRQINQQMESETDQYLRICSNPQRNNGFITYNDFKTCISTANRQRA